MIDAISFWCALSLIMVVGFRVGKDVTKEVCSLLQDLKGTEHPLYMKILGIITAGFLITWLVLGIYGLGALGTY